MGTFTMGTGFGMLAVGLIAISIASLIGFYIINKIQKAEQETLKQKREERRSWI